MKKIKLTICMALVFTMLAGLFPVFAAEPQETEQQQKLELHAFYSAQMSFSEETKKYIDAVDSVSFAWGRLYGDLSEGIVTSLGKNGNTMFYYPEDYTEVLKYTKSKNKSMQLNIFSDSVNAEKILPYKDQRTLAVKAIVDLLNKEAVKGEEIYFDGVVIDIEGLQNKDADGKFVYINGSVIGVWYGHFLKELKAELDKMDKKLYAAVNPLLNYTGYDYKKISETVDKMIVMAHDYEPVTKLNKSQVLQYTGYNSLNPIDSLAPIKKIGLVMEDIKQYVSEENRDKVMLQISFDAAQWRFQLAKGGTWEKTDEQAMSLEARNVPTYRMIYDRVQNKDKKGTCISYGYNNELQSPYIQYVNTSDNTQNVLLYENSISVKAKMDLVKQYGLGGISLWSLGNVPDYSDKISKTYGLDVWDTVLKALPVSLDTTKETKVIFKDKVVETAIRKQLQKNTGEVYPSDLKRVYRLAVSAGYKSLEDIKLLSNLEYLDLSNTGLNNLSALSALKNLRVLYLQRNSIKDITALGVLSKLEVLSINGNKVSNIGAVAKMTQLKELYIRENLISDYTPAAGLKNLNVLYLGGNPSKNFSKLTALKKGLLACDF